MSYGIYVREQMGHPACGEADRHFVIEGEDVVSWCTRCHDWITRQKTWHVIDPLRGTTWEDVQRNGGRFLHALEVA